MMRILRVLTLAALVAAVPVLALPAAADQCPPPGGDSDPDCRLSPLQSRQVNPDTSLATGALSSLDAPPTRFGAHFATPLSLGAGSRPAAGPVFVDPVPIASGSEAPPFETLDLRMRYQDPSDVSCGVQTLGMALNGLGPPAPVSSAMLGYLQDQGMMYDFGTGVEELAFTAQSYGYAGSRPFYGGSLAQLQSELAAGRPVVVDLGANGEGQPGHFVTLTGISPDGNWVAFNDPILGKQVIPASDFLRQWSLQGNTGVTVGPSAALASVSDPIASPTTHPDPSNADPFLILMAAAMALLSNAGLGLSRKGIGGRLVEGTTLPARKSTKKSSSRSSSSSRKKKEKSKKHSTPPPAVERAEALFEATAPPPPTPPPPRGVAKAEEAFEATAPPKDPPVPMGMAKAEEAFEATMPVALDQRVIDGTLPPGGTTTTTDPDPTLVLRNLLDPLPNIAIPFSEKDQVSLNLVAVEMGHQYGWTYLRDTDGETTVTPYNWSRNVLGAKLQFSKEELSLKATLPFGKTTAFQTDDGGEISYQQSVSMKLTWDGWNTTSEVAYRSIDYKMSGGSGLTKDNSVSGYQGIYVKDKPIQMVLAGELAKMAIAGAILGIDEAAAVALELGRKAVTGPEVAH